jgi:glycosyltransferase involved in cell wall biosynthesis
MGSVPKIARQLATKARVVVLSGGSRTRVEDRSPSLRVYFQKEWLIPDPVNNGFVPGLWRALRAIVRKEKPDAVLNVKYMFYPNLAGPYLHRRGYRVVTVTDTFPGYTWFAASWFVNAALWLYTRTFGLYVLRRSDRVVLFHEGLVATARKLHLPYTVIHNGVELDLLDAAKPKQLLGKIRVLYVSRLESVKGYKTICEAMRIVAARNSDVHFYQIGDWSGHDSFVAEYASDQMHFLGRKPLAEVYAYLRSAHIVVLGSKSEGLPNALLEGMAAGAVGVSTPVGAVPELLDGGKCGRLYSYGNTQALVKHIEWLASHPAQRKRMAAAGRAKVRAEYNWEFLVDKYYSVLFPDETMAHKQNRPERAKT